MGRGAEWRSAQTRPSQVSTLATSSNFSRRARCTCIAAAVLDRPRFIPNQYFPGCVPSRYGDEATIIHRWSTPPPRFDHHRRRLVTAPPARFAHASNSTTLILLIANHGGSLRNGDSCSGRAHKVFSPPQSTLYDAEADTHPSSLPQDEVPIKLRCAICSKLAVNAFRTPCCEQMICENCEYSLFHRARPLRR